MAGATGIRARLRSGTAASHGRIDRRMEQLDLTTVTGLSRLLGAHYLVQSHLEAALPASASMGFLPALRADFGVMSSPAPVWDRAPEVSSIHPLGYRYVIGGSQMGAKLLYREWDRTEDDTVRAAGHYLAANMKSRSWRDLLSELKRMELDAEEADAVLASANQVFSLYDLAATQLGIPVAPGGN